MRISLIAKRRKSLEIEDRGNGFKTLPIAGYVTESQEGRAEFPKVTLGSRMFIRISPLFSSLNSFVHLYQPL